jgi:tripartite-type tricarboxylate transporter receptor subunit TctC
MVTTKRARALTCAAALLLPFFAHAQPPWPSEPIKLIVPFAPGGGNDSIGRLIAKQLQERLKTPVVVDNRAGANGTIGMNVLRQAKPDGYTIATVSSGPLDVNPSLFGVPYDPSKDFTYIGPMVKFPLFLAASTHSGIKSVGDLLAKAKAEPGRVTYSSAGVGNATHLAGALLANMTDTQMVHVPYKGTGPAAVAVLSGEVTFTFGSGPSIQEYVKSGKVTGLGLSELQRLPDSPDIRTIAEQGVTGFEASSWGGLVAPAGLPPDIARKLSATLLAIMQDPAVRKQVSGQGMLPIAGTSSDFEKMVNADREKWAVTIKKANIKAE